MPTCGTTPWHGGGEERLLRGPERHCKVVQVEAMKPSLKTPGSMLSKLIYDGPLSNFALKMNLHRYSTAAAANIRAAHSGAALAAGAYTRPLFSST